MNESTLSLADVRRAIESGVRAGLAESLRLLAERPATARTHAKVSEWLAERIDDHLQRTGRGGLSALALAVGVTPPTVRRWQARTTRVASEHLPALLSALGTTEEEMRRDLGLDATPRVRARHPRKRQPAPLDLPV